MANNKTTSDLVIHMLENNIPLRPVVRMTNVREVETMNDIPLHTILTRIVRRLNVAKSNGNIKDYKIHKIDNEYFYELV